MILQSDGVKLVISKSGGDIVGPHCPQYPQYKQYKWHLHVTNTNMTVISAQKEKLYIDSCNYARSKIS